MTHPTRHLHDDHAHAHGEAHSHSEAGVQSEILDLDAAVLAEHTAAIIQGLPLAEPPRKIVDLGCGTGAGTFALLRHYPLAQVTAVDASADHLARLNHKARAIGVEERVRTVQADLDAPDWPELSVPDLVWASASMHHMAHPDLALRKIHGLLAPQGLFAVVELSGLPRFLPADAPADRPGLEERCHQASDRLHAHHVPHRGADWGPMLTRAGFTLADEHTITVNIDASRDNAVGTYALSTLNRLRAKVADALDPDDLAALDRLLDADSPHGITHRDDLAVRTERTVWAARPAN